MGTKLKYFRRRGKRGVLYLQERHCGILLKHCLNTTDEKIAEIRRREIHIAVERGEYKSWKIAFKDAVDESFGALVAGKALNTRRNYRISLYKHLIPWFGNARLYEIDRFEMSEYKKMREDQGVGQIILTRELWLARWLLSKYRREVAPLRGPYRKPHKPIDRFPEESEVLKIIGEVGNLVYRSISLVSAYTGLRKVDVLKLRWSMMYFFDRVYSVSPTKNGALASLTLTSYAGRCL